LKTINLDTDIQRILENQVEDHNNNSADEEEHQTSSSD